MYNGLENHPNNGQRRALMLYRLSCWTRGYHGPGCSRPPKYLEGAGEPVLLPPTWATCLEDAKSTQQQTDLRGHGQHKHHHTPAAKSVDMEFGKRNTYEFALPICVITVPDDWDLRRVEFVPALLGKPWPEQDAPLATVPTVAADSPAVEFDKQIVTQHEQHSPVNQTEEACNKKPQRKTKNEAKKQAQARQHARDAKLA
eukprot:TRINITY_DN52160_c0_g1_i1.p1 TRINITY_DN52160_c0_g1~~TRINITY_DN52160_c0_g1_i1.p1  ORF type:complete len:216 (+),score=24.44 TRINITY_DN52160_c0_g1_i1:50-649(+)